MLQDERPKFIEYSDERHSYYVDGTEYISVTTVLDLAGMISPFARDEEARERGLAVHKLTAEDDATRWDLRYVPQHLRGYIRAWRKYRQDTGFNPSGIEIRIDNHTHQYAGRIDRIGWRPGASAGITTIVDIKTSVQGQVSDTTRLQLAAYGNAIRAGAVFERIGVALRPDGRYNCKIFDMHDYQRDVAEFLQILKRVKASLCQQSQK